MTAIVSESGPILILGAGPIESPDLAAVAGVWAACVCADGGLTTALAQGIKPSCVIGDLDSAGPNDLATAACVVHDTDQDTTDFQKCLGRVDAPSILALGVLGGRMDHHLASLSAMLKDPRPVFAIGGGEVSVVLHRSLGVTLDVDVPVSLYPLLPMERVTAEGLVWPLSDQALAPDGLIATSNRMAGARLNVTVAQTGLLLTLPIAWLGVLMAAMQPGGDLCAE